ncbi:unnamed protein product [Ilex paraguariensis]|uniref:Uncharacterized protein n=1 Tax=Ilex paraguariensis TaxID=185542 RepID=A0ABC8SMZ0_9AQUA
MCIKDAPPHCHQSGQSIFNLIYDSTYIQSKSIIPKPAQYRFRIRNKACRSLCKSKYLYVGVKYIIIKGQPVWSVMKILSLNSSCRGLRLGWELFPQLALEQTKKVTIPRSEGQDGFRIYETRVRYG